MKMNRRDLFKYAVVIAISPSVVFAKNEPRIHEFSILAGIDGNPVSATIHPDQEASFEASIESGRDSAARLMKIFNE